ncbi:MAG: wecA [Actinomycetia bacterium]|nr:wecA [Actinomycetes bacterium]
MPSTAAFALVFGVAAGTTFVLTPVLRWLALRMGVVDHPDERRVHTQPMPYLGGIAMLLGFLAALGVAWRMQGFDPMFEGSSVPLGIAIGAVVLCGVGTLDDIREVSAPAKTAGMVLGGSVMYLLGVSLLYFRFPFVDGLLVLGPDLAPLVTVLWVLGMANAVNLIDGLDGLAAGIVAIAAGSFFLYGHRLANADVGLISPDNPSTLIAISVAGICLGFLPHNFNPARIFMGDGGALMLGGLMAASTIMVGGQVSDPYSGQAFFFFAPLFIPFFVMGVPIIDTVFAIVRRARKRAGLAEADKDHLHHRLMRLGHGHRRAVVILWAWSALLSGIALYPVYTRKGDAIVPIGVVALALVLLTFLHPGVRQAREAEAEVVELPVPGEAPADGGPVPADANGDAAAVGAAAEEPEPLRP